MTVRVIELDFMCLGIKDKVPILAIDYHMECILRQVSTSKALSVDITDSVSQSLVFITKLDRNHRIRDYNQHYY